MKDGTRYLLYAIALILSVGAPAGATLYCFPIWQAEGGGAMLSGLALFLLIICAVPLVKLIRQVLASPSAPIVWLLIFLFFFLFKRIAAEITFISLVGAISNFIGAILFKIAKIKRAEK